MALVVGKVTDEGRAILGGWPTIDTGKTAALFGADTVGNMFTTRSYIYELNYRLFYYYNIVINFSNQSLESWNLVAQGFVPVYILKVSQ
jgi:hypothetical protein